MSELLTSEPIVASSADLKWGKAARPRPVLRLRWTIDPTTGKPAARWVVAGSEPVGAVELAAA